MLRLKMSDAREQGQEPVAFVGRRLAQAWYLSVAMAWGMYLMAYTYYAVHIVGGDEDEAVELSTRFTVVYACGSLVGSPVLGRLSDSIGRRRIMLLGATANLAGFAALGASPTVVSYLCVGAAVGALDATTAVARACIVDFVAEASMNEAALAGSSADYWLSRQCYALVGRPPETAVEALMVENTVLVCHGHVGMIIGVVLGEVAKHFLGARWTIACAGLSLAPIILALLLRFPETRHAREDAPHLARIAARLKSSTRLGVLLAAYALAALGVLGINAVALYFLEDVAGLGGLDVLLLVLEALLLAPLGALVALRSVAPRLGLAATLAALAAVSSLGSLAIALTPFLPVQGLLLPAATLYFLGFNLMPLAVAPLSDDVPYDDQGTLQGLVYALAVAATLLGAELATALYTSLSPYLPFLACAGLTALAGSLFYAAGDPPASPADGAMMASFLAGTAADRSAAPDASPTLVPLLPPPPPKKTSP
mmetsp:Transcript_1466/g.4365  ORF Transcript_1466/g.4365 Transcript_1466/m.4365 type:complete len:483 (+) Transcript_1466:2-1450(+)